MNKTEAQIVSYGILYLNPPVPTFIEEVYCCLNTSLTDTKWRHWGRPFKPVNSLSLDVGATISH